MNTAKHQLQHMQLEFAIFLILVLRPSGPRGPNEVDVTGKAIMRPTSPSLTSRSISIASPGRTTCTDLDTGLGRKESPHDRLSVVFGARRTLGDDDKIPPPDVWSESFDDRYDSLSS